jgi:hypothetical protein
MKIQLTHLGILAAIILGAPQARAFDKVGTTAAQFLQIGVGGRLPGMGSAGVAAVEGAEALYWNPAGLTRTESFSLYAYYSDWFADLRHQFIGFSTPLGSAGVIGFHAITLGGDEFEQTTLSFQEGNGVMVEYLDLALGISYAHQLTDRFSVGGTVKYVYQKLFAETAGTVAADIGTSLSTDLPGFSIGMAMTNLGGDMTLEGSDLLVSGPDEEATQYQVSSWPLPLTFRVGVAWWLWGAGDAFMQNEYHGGLLVIDGQHINEGMTFWRMGMEYNFRQALFFRFGRVFQHHTETWSLGTGLKIPLGSYGIKADFAYATLEDLGVVRRVSLEFTGR